MKKYSVIFMIMFHTFLVAQKFSEQHFFEIYYEFPNTYDFFSKAVAINEDFYFISASSSDGDKRDGGVVHIYDRQTNELIDKLPKTFNPSRKAHFGFSMDANANFLVVSSDQEVGKKGNRSGKVYIYEFDKGYNEWKLMEVLEGDGGKDRDGFGKHVKIDQNNRILITEDAFDSYNADSFEPSKNNINDSSDGKAYVYSLDEDNQWVRDKGELTFFELDSDNPLLSEGYKQRMGQESGDIEGDYLAIGARWYKSKKDTQRIIGAVNVFKKDNNAVWQKWQRITVKDSLSKCCERKIDKCHTGASVALDGSFLAFSVKAASVKGFKKAGQVYIFKRKNGKYIQETVIEEPILRRSSYFGSKIFLKKDMLLISSLTDGGVVYVYHQEGEVWKLKQTIKQDADQVYKFGRSLFMYDNLLLIGADFNKLGRAYLYKK